MIFLGLAVLCSTINSTIIRLSNDNVKNNMCMFSGNYLMCIVIGLIYQLLNHDQIHLYKEDMGITLSLGAVGGVLFLVSYMLLQRNTKINGMALSATFMKLGILVPTIMAIIVFKEKPTLCQYLGIVISLVAIIFFHFEQNKGRTTNKRLLLALLLTGGISDSVSNVFNHVGKEQYNNLFLLIIFLVAFLFSLFMNCVSKQKMSLMDIIWGLLLGIPNYYSTRFLLLSLASVPAAIAFPVYSVGTIILTTSIGVVKFKEEMNKRKWFSMCLIAVSLILLNI